MRESTDVVIPPTATAATLPAKQGTAGSRNGTGAATQTAEPQGSTPPPGGTLGALATGLLYRGLKLTASAIIVRVVVGVAVVLCLVSCACCVLYLVVYALPCVALLCVLRNCVCSFLFLFFTTHIYIHMPPPHRLQPTWQPRLARRQKPPWLRQRRVPMPDEAPPLPSPPPWISCPSPAPPRGTRCECCSARDCPYALCLCVLFGCVCSLGTCAFCCCASAKYGHRRNLSLRSH